MDALLWLGAEFVTYVDEGALILAVLEGGYVLLWMLRAIRRGE